MTSGAGLPSDLPWPRVKLSRALRASCYRSAEPQELMIK